jgi:hypothetical protein
MIHKSCAEKILMVKPALFGFNAETAGTNVFQHQQAQVGDTHQRAIKEFMRAAETLETKGVEVIVVESDDKDAPDSIFPNNWFSTHQDGTLVYYPMLAENRRRERNEKTITSIQVNFSVNKVIDLSRHEMENRFLEGTGSIVFDHDAAKAYATIGPRTDKDLFYSLCAELGYEPLSYSCLDPSGLPFYHTNVILHIGNDYAVIYQDGIIDSSEKKKVLSSLEQSNETIIDITFEQVLAFCGNMLQVKNKKGEPLLLCSETALKSFENTQIKTLERYSEIIPFHIPTIEQIGGGSIRCMLAELF